MVVVWLNGDPVAASNRLLGHPFRLLNALLILILKLFILQRSTFRFSEKYSEA